MTKDVKRHEAHGSHLSEVVSEPKALEVCLDLCVQPLCLGLLLPPLGCEARHLLLEGFAVVGLRLGADVAAGSEDVAMFANLFESCALAEAGGVGVALILTHSQWERGVHGLAAPCVVRVGDAGDVFRCQVSMGPVHHAAQLSGVDEQGLAPPVSGRHKASPCVGFAAAPGEEPEAGGYLGGPEELAR